MPNKTEKANPAAQQWAAVERALLAVLSRCGCSPAQCAEVAARFKPVFLQYPDAFGVDLSKLPKRKAEAIVSKWVQGIVTGPQYGAALAELGDASEQGK